MNIRRNCCLIIFVAIFWMAGCHRPQTHIKLPDGTMPIIFADCTARYFKADKTTYITRQTHQFDTGENFFALTAKEPTGPVHYSLFSGRFNTTAPRGQELSDIPREFCTPMLANGIFYSFCAGSELLDTSQMLTSENVKLEGRWYQPFTAVSLGNTGFLITLYKALDTGRIELVELSESEMERVEAGPLTHASKDKIQNVWLFRSYNLRYSRQLERKLPRAIDVFDIREGLASKKFVAQFQYEDIQNVASIQNLQIEK